MSSRGGSTRADDNARSQVFAGRKASRVVIIPPEYRRDTYRTEANNLVNDIKTSCSCDVNPIWDQTDRKIRRFELYGAGQSIESATRYLNNWIPRSGHRSKHSAMWAKMSAFNWDDWYVQKVGEMDTARRQMFKGPAPETSQSERRLFTAELEWPQDLLGNGVVPRDVFGSKAEVLDRLRVQDEVFITLIETKVDKSNPKKKVNDDKTKASTGEMKQIHNSKVKHQGSTNRNLDHGKVDQECQSDSDEKLVEDEEIAHNLWHFSIVGYTSQHLQNAQMHLQTMIDKVRLDMLEQETTLNLILDAREGIDVRLQHCEDWWPNKFDQVVPRLAPSGIMNNPGSFRQERMHHTHLSSIRRSLALALEKIRHRKGYYDFVVRLGSLVLSSKHVPASKVGETFTKDKFNKQINLNIDLHVKKWLADNETGYDILKCMKRADDILEPTRPSSYYGIVPRSLNETRPKLLGTWVFRDPSRANDTIQLFMVVQIDWTEDEHGMYEKGQARFYKLESGQMGMKGNMDINLLELGESRGWEFALDSMIPVSRETAVPWLVGFTEQVVVHPKYDVCSTEPFAKWDKAPTTAKGCLVTTRLDMIYSFGIRDTCYKVELMSMWYPGQKIPVWGLGIRHIQWEEHLALLENLAIGERAEWGSTIETFFPKDGVYSSYSGGSADDLSVGDLSLNSESGQSSNDGLEIFMEKLLQISGLVSSVTQGDGAPV